MQKFLSYIIFCCETKQLKVEPAQEKMGKWHQFQTLSLCHLRSLSVATLSALLHFTCTAGTICWPTGGQLLWRPPLSCIFVEHQKTIIAKKDETILPTHLLCPVRPPDPSLLLQFWALIHSSHLFNQHQIFDSTVFGICCVNCLCGKIKIFISLRPVSGRIRFTSRNQCQYRGWASASKKLNLWPRYPDASPMRTWNKKFATLRSCLCE